MLGWDVHCRQRCCRRTRSGSWNLVRGCDDHVNRGIVDCKKYLKSYLGKYSQIRNINLKGTREKSYSSFYPLQHSSAGQDCRTAMRLVKRSPICSKTVSDSKFKLENGLLAKLSCTGISRFKKYYVFNLKTNWPKKMS